MEIQKHITATLRINGKPKTFKSRNITMGASWEALDLSERIETPPFSKEKYEEAAQFLLGQFDNQFSMEDFGTMEGSFAEIVPAMLGSIVGGFSARIKNFPNEMALAGQMSPSES